MILLAYLFVGLLCARFVRGRVEVKRTWIANPKHGRMCETVIGYGSCDNYRGECGRWSNPHQIRNIWFVLSTPLLWPVYFLGWFLLTEKLPRLPHKETQEEKFQRMLATDETFAGIYGELNEKYKVG